MEIDGSTPAASTHIALVGNYLPRKCGIATYTTDTYQRAASAAFPT